MFQASQPRVIGHRGGFPGVSSALWIDLDHGYTVAVLANIDGGAEPIQENLKELIVRVGEWSEEAVRSPRGSERDSPSGT